MPGAERLPMPPQGGFLAMLTLSNAVYFYFFLPALLLLWLGARKADMTSMLTLRLIGVFALVFALLTGAWMARNHSHFGRFYLTERGGGVLSGRALYTAMTMREYLASFLYWTPNATAQRLLNTYFSPDEYRNIDREYENGYRARIIAREQELLKQTGSQVETDKLLVAEGWQALRTHFLKHLATTVPFAYQGHFRQPSPVHLERYLYTERHVCVLSALPVFIHSHHPQSASAGRRLVCLPGAVVVLLCIFFIFYPQYTPVQYAAAARAVDRSNYCSAPVCRPAYIRSRRQAVPVLQGGSPQKPEA